MRRKASARLKVFARVLDLIYLGGVKRRLGCEIVHYGVIGP